MKAALYLSRGVENLKKVIIPAAVLIVLTAAVITVIALNPFSSDKSANGASAADGNSTASGNSLSDTLAELYSSMLEDKQVAATVNGEPIYRSSIEFVIESEKMSKQSAMNASELTSSQKAVFENLPRSFEEILNEQIENTLLYKEAEKAGIKGDYDNILKSIKDNYYSLESAAKAPNADDDTKKAYEDTNKLIETYYKSKEDYFAKAASAINYNSMVDKYKENYLKKVDSSEKDKEEAFKRHTEELVSKADVVIY